MDRWILTYILHLCQFLPSDVQAQLGLARPDDGLRKSKPEPQALKSLSWPKPWAQAAALHT